MESFQIYAWETSHCPVSFSWEINTDKMSWATFFLNFTAGLYIHLQPIYPEYPHPLAYFARTNQQDNFEQSRQLIKLLIQRHRNSS